MPRVPATLQNRIVSTPDNQSNWLSLRKIYEQLARVINGTISFGDGRSSDNIAGVWVTVTTPVAPNTDFVVTHNLGYVVSGYVIMIKDRACDIYTSPTANPNPRSQIILRATVASAMLSLFIL